MLTGKTCAICACIGEGRPAVVQGTIDPAEVVQAFGQYATEGQVEGKVGTFATLQPRTVYPVCAFCADLVDGPGRRDRPPSAREVLAAVLREGQDDDGPATLDAVAEELVRVGVGLDDLGPVDAIGATLEADGRVTLADDGAAVTLPLEGAFARLRTLPDRAGWAATWEALRVTPMGEGGVNP